MKLRFSSLSRRFSPCRSLLSPFSLSSRCHNHDLTLCSNGDHLTFPACYLRAFALIALPSRLSPPSTSLLSHTQAYLTVDERAECAATVAMCVMNAEGRFGAPWMGGEVQGHARNHEREETDQHWERMKIESRASKTWASQSGEEQTRIVENALEREEQESRQVCDKAVHSVWNSMEKVKRELWENEYLIRDEICFGLHTWEMTENGLHWTRVMAWLAVHVVELHSKP